jgi:hypothetical protein
LANLGMKVYWHITCDYGHKWGGFLEEDAEILMRCPEGHEAVICCKEPPIDQVQVTIRPAGRIVDKVTKKSAGDRQVWIVVSDIQGCWEYQSQKIYSWREAEKIVRLFECCPLERQSKSLSRDNFRVMNC